MTVPALSEVEEQATGWWVENREQGNVIEKRAGFQAWLAQSPEHWKVYNRTRILCDQMRTWLLEHSCRA